MTLPQRRPVPVDAKRKDWPRLAAEGVNHLQQDITLLVEKNTGAADWAAATGTATRTTFDTATVTLPELAEHVKALLDDLLANGSIK